MDQTRESSYDTRDALALASQCSGVRWRCRRYTAESGRLALGAFRPVDEMVACLVFRGPQLLCMPYGFDAALFESVDRSELPSTLAAAALDLRRMHVVRIRCVEQELWVVCREVGFYRVEEGRSHDR